LGPTRPGCSLELAAESLIRRGGQQLICMNTILEWLLVLVIVASTLAFGGVQPLSYSLMEVLLFLAVLLLGLKQSRQGKISFPLPLGATLFLLVAVLQVVPLPAPWVEILSPPRLLDAHLPGLPPGAPGWMTLSIYPHATLLAALRFLAFVCAFGLAAYLFDSTRRKSILVQCLIFMGSFEAAYGIYQYLSGSPRIFTYVKQYNLADATGTYINRDHFARFLELTVPFAAASVFQSFQLWSERRQPGASRRAHPEQSTAGIRSFFYLFLLVLMVVAVFFAHSRSGILITLFSVMFLAFLALAQLRMGRKLWLLGVLLFVFCVVGYGAWIGLGSVLARFEEGRGSGSLGIEGRLLLWKDELRLVQDYPLLGTGLGTFGMAFRRYRTTLLEGRVDHAHNDYLEFASDTGLLGAALVFLPILYLLARLVISFLKDTRRYRRAVSLGCIGSSLALLLHSLTDFNLQIPANALIFAVVLGIGYKAACVETREESTINAGPVAVRIDSRSRSTVP